MWIPCSFKSATMREKTWQRARGSFSGDLRIPLGNHGRLIADMVSELEKQVVRITGKLDGMRNVISEESSMEAKKQYFSDKSRRCLAGCGRFTRLPVPS